MTQSDYPITRAVADTGVLVEFGNKIDDEVHQRVLDLDAAVQSACITGLTECVPSYTCLLVGYNPLETSYDEVCQQIQPLFSGNIQSLLEPQHWKIPTCYAKAFAPDLEDAARQLDVSPNELVAQHLSGQYKVYMYGFAPGYAFLGGVPKPIQLPRKTAPVMNVPPQTVMMAGPQGLITSLPMPTGWWRIGMTTFKPLDMDKEHPFVLNVGDTLEFVELSEVDFKHHNQSA